MNEIYAPASERPESDSPSTKYICPINRLGKSGGFRVTYEARLSDRVTLPTIYSKTDDIVISVAEIRDLVMEAEG